MTQCLKVSPTDLGSIAIPGDLGSSPTPEASPLRASTVVPFLTADHVPSEALDGSSAPPRSMPWAPTGKAYPTVHPDEKQMVDRLGDLVDEVNQNLADGTEDPSLSKVGVVGGAGGSRGSKAGLLPALGKSQDDHWAALRAEWNELEAETDTAEDEAPEAAPEFVEDARPRSRGILGFLRRRRATPEFAPEEAFTPEDLNAIKSEKFSDRLNRIQRGRQWQPDGVVHAVGRRRTSSNVAFSKRPNVRFGVFVMFLAVIGVLVVGPENIESYVQIASDTMNLDSWSDAVSGDQPVNIATTSF